MHSNSFPPIVDENSSIVILGSMPGKKSLEMNEYYAHKQNSFWRILFLIFEKEYSECYKEKILLLKKHGIALWDTLYACEREGSSDASIVKEVPNDFLSFFERYPKIRFVFFNGKVACLFFSKHIKPDNRLNYLTLPSTSPAHARLSFAEKLKQWSVVKEILMERNE